MLKKIFVLYVLGNIIKKHVDNLFILWTVLHLKIYLMKLYCNNIFIIWWQENIFSDMYKKYCLILTLA